MAGPGDEEGSALPGEPSRELGRAPRDAGVFVPADAVPRGDPRLFAHTCGYLPERTAVTEARYFRAITQAGYLEALHRGYRRFGDLFFRPRCPGCDLCISYRIRAQRFERDRRRWRRVRERNRAIRVEVGPVRADDAAVAVANDFYRHRLDARGWPETRYSVDSYAQQFASGPVEAREARYYRGDELLGVGLFDDLPDGETAVIFHYREAWQAESPGTFNILWLIDRARARGLPFVYLGFYVPTSVSTTYKASFRPADVLRRGRWFELPGSFDPATDPYPLLTSARRDPPAR